MPPVPLLAARAGARTRPAGHSRRLLVAVLRLAARMGIGYAWLCLPCLLSLLLQTNTLGAAPASLAPAQPSGDLTGPWQLLVDDALVSEKIHLRRTYHPFEKHPGGPVLKADKPWEGRMAYLYGTVLPAGATNHGYRMWYHSWAGEYRNLYATSEDGVHWAKPELGLVDVAGSKANNVFLRRTKEDHLPQVIATPWETSPEQRFKLINYDYGRSGPEHSVSGFWGATSVDGIHWRDVPGNPVLRDPGDVGNFVWDFHASRYVGYTKVFAPVRGFRRRCVGFTATTDFTHWPSSQLILTPDEYDDRWVTTPQQRTEFYGLSAFPYEAGYLGFLWVFRVTDGKNDGPIYPELVSSRDGIRWTRQDLARGGRVPMVPLGAPGAWDGGMIFTPNQPVVEDGSIKLWYGGVNITHGGPDAQAEGGIGLATLRKDGFASLDAGDVEGTLTTRPLKQLVGPLRINADASRGWIKAEVLTGDGRVEPGYGRNDCDPIKVDGLDQIVTWRGDPNLPSSTQAPLRLRFIFQQAAIYSFAAGPRLTPTPVGEAPNRLPDVALTFEEAAKATPELRTTVATLRVPGTTNDAPYTLLEPEPRPIGKKGPLLVYLYGAGGSHEDYNLRRPPYDKIRAGLGRLGYHILVPELGPVHWMNPAARQLLDQIVDHIVATHPIDPERIQVMGTSMGGGSALAYAIQRPDRVRAVCCHMGMTDFAQWIQESPRFWNSVTQAYGGSPVEVPGIYRGTSAMQNLDVFSNIPVFLMAGGADTTVLPQQDRRLADALSARGYLAVYREAAGMGHDDQTSTPFADELVEFFANTADLGATYRLHGGAIVQNGSERAAFGSGALILAKATPPSTSNSPSPSGSPSNQVDAIELSNTTHLGTRFTLAANVRPTQHRLMRLFSNHRGSGEFVTGELVFDFDPAAKAIPGLRFIVNGQAILSRPLVWTDEGYHHLAATFDRGRVALYFDGEPVGDGLVLGGTAHLSYDRTVAKHFDMPDALSEIGIHLANNLRVGADADGHFITYQDEVPAASGESMSGDIDDVLVAQDVLTADDVRQLSRKGLDLCKRIQ